MGKEKTKDTLLDAGRRVFSERGYNASGIEAILQEAGVPKGSFYYYFASKEDFGLRVIDRFAEDHDAELGRFLDDPSLGPLEGLRRYHEEIVARLESNACRNGCLVGNLSQEMADQNETFRARLDQVFAGWADRYAGRLERAKEAGEIPAHLDPRELAEFWLNGWQGAVLRAKISRGTAPLRSFLSVLFGTILKG